MHLNVPNNNVPRTSIRNTAHKQWFAIIITQLSSTINKPTWLNSATAGDGIAQDKGFILWLPSKNSRVTSLCSVGLWLSQIITWGAFILVSCLSQRHKHFSSKYQVLLSACLGIIISQIFQFLFSTLTPISSIWKCFANTGTTTKPILSIYGTLRREGHVGHASFATTLWYYSNWQADNKQNAEASLLWGLYWIIQLVT